MGEGLSRDGGPQQRIRFMVGEISQDQIDQIVFGDEGQGWKMMPITDFLDDDQVYGSLKERLRDWMELTDEKS